MAKPPGPIGRAKREERRQRILARGQTKLHKRDARRAAALERKQQAND